jgi:hypothetical protein
MVLQSARGPASSSAQGRRRQRRRNAPARGLVALGVDRPDPSVSARDEGRRVPLPFGSSTHPSSARRGHELRRGRRWTGSRETDRNTARSLPPECSRPPPGADRNTGAGGHRLGQPADAHPIGAAGGVVRPRREIGSDAGSTRCRGPAERARRAFGAHVRSGRAGHLIPHPPTSGGRGSDRSWPVKDEDVVALMTPGATTSSPPRGRRRLPGTALRSPVAGGSNARPG